MSDWSDRVTEEIQRIYKNASPEDKKVLPIPGVTNPNNNSVLLVFVAILCVAIFFIYQMKVNAPQISAWPQYPNQQAQSYSQAPNWHHWQSPDISSRTEQLLKQYEALDAAAVKIWERTKWNTDHITLLATVNNHNLVVLQQGLSRNELIYINSDFTINKMPDRITLDAEDQEFIRKFIRK